MSILTKESMEHDRKQTKKCLDNSFLKASESYEGDTETKEAVPEFVSGREERRKYQLTVYLYVKGVDTIVDRLFRKTIAARQREEWKHIVINLRRAVSMENVIREKQAILLGMCPFFQLRHRSKFSGQAFCGHQAESM